MNDQGQGHSEVISSKINCAHQFHLHLPQMTHFPVRKLSVVAPGPMFLYIRWVHPLRA